MARHDEFMGDFLTQAFVAHALLAVAIVLVIPLSLWFVHGLRTGLWNPKNHPESKFVPSRAPGPDAYHIGPRGGIDTTAKVASYTMFRRSKSTFLAAFLLLRSVSYPSQIQVV